MIAYKRVHPTCPSWRVLATFTLAATLLSACGKSDQDAPPPAPGERQLVFAFVPKLRDNPVFNRAKVAAEKRAAEVGGITIDWQAPTEADPAKQVEIIETLITRRVDGIAVSCNEPTALEQPINDAIEAGIPTITFDSDSPNSNRITYYGTNDLESGHILGTQLVKSMGGKGTVVVMSGVAGAFNLETRIKGVEEIFAQHPGMEVVQTVYCDDDIAKSVSQIEDVMRARPNLGGWAMVGGWPLFADRALDPIDPPGSTKVVSFDALPEQWVYLEENRVELLIAQRIYGWGAESVDILKGIIDGQTYDRNTYSGVDLVTAENLEEYKIKWKDWFNE